MKLKTAAGFGFAAVALGAFGAHGLKPVLEARGMAAVWDTAVLYHLVHAVALLSLALARPRAKWPFRLVAAGIVLFSGSLYMLALTGVSWLGAVTPAGGLCLLAGWGALLRESGR